MKNEKSYTEMMKAQAMSRLQERESYLFHLYLDMFLRDVLWTHNEQRLRNDIDAALDAKDYDAFQSATSALHKHLLAYGS